MKRGTKLGYCYQVGEWIFVTEIQKTFIAEAENKNVSRSRHDKLGYVS